MTNYDLAFDEDGEPFAVPPQVAGWRVRRAADGRGRPALIRGRGSNKGKPLIVRPNATHDELLAAAGPGRYRLEAVDEHWHKIEGVPVACTGQLSADDDGPSEDDAAPEVYRSAASGSAVRQVTSYEDVLCTVVTANTRMVEKALGEMGTVMAGVAGLLQAAHNAGITSRVPPPMPPPPPPPVEHQDHEEEDDEEDDDEEAEAEQEEAEAATTGFGIPDFLQVIIKDAVNKLVPLIFEKITSGGLGGLAGMPLEAILDWRKAVPTSAAAASVPSVPVPPSVPATPTTTTPTPTPPNAPSWPTSTIHGSPAVTPTPTPSPPAVAVTGAAPSDDSPPGAAPAERLAAPAASSPRTHEDAAALINAHVLQVWQGLSPPERARAGQLIARLTAEERTAWLAELAKFTVPEAIARARAVLHGQPAPTPPIPQLPPTPQGEPS